MIFITRSVVSANAKHKVSRRWHDFVDVFFLFQRFTDRKLATLLLLTHQRSFERAGMLTDD